MTNLVTKLHQLLHPTTRRLNQHQALVTAFVWRHLHRGRMALINSRSIKDVSWRASTGLDSFSGRNFWRRQDQRWTLSSFITTSGWDNESARDGGWRTPNMISYSSRFPYPSLLFHMPLPHPSHSHALTPYPRPMPFSFRPYAHVFSLPIYPL